MSRTIPQKASQGISESYLRWRGIEATLQLSQSTNSKVVVIGSGKDSLPIILGNVDTPAPTSAGSTPPTGNDTMNKESTTAAPTVPLEKTPAAVLATPAEKIPASSSTPSAATPEGSRSFWPISLSDIETYLSHIVRPTEPKTVPRSRQPSERSIAEQPR